jgi:cellulose synthase (UDP-forming)
VAIILEGCVTARPAGQIGNQDRVWADPPITAPLPAEPVAETPVAKTLGFAARWQVRLIFALAAATCAGTVLATLHVTAVLRQAAEADRAVLILQAALVYGLFYLLVGGNLAYQCAEYGCIRRMARSRPEIPVEPSASPLYAGGSRKKLLVLVPSYKEQPDVVRQTLLSAALAEHPGRRVVLLIDDPPEQAGQDNKAAAGLLACRAIPGELQALFDAEADRIEAALPDCSAPAEDLAALYDSVADWLDGLAELAGRIGSGPGASGHHTDALFRDRILHAPAHQHRLHAASLRLHPPGPEGILREMRRLRALLRVEFSSFERKSWVNLSHAPNKAMNLNSYIGLIGGSFSAIHLSDGLHLLRCDPAEAAWHVPEADYIVTVDADSLITSDYALRLVAAMELPGNEGVAVVQTPYTAVPNAPAALERAAAASTDSQFFTHQGMAFFGASFWVGASALIRHAALLDIARTVFERGYAVRVFIDDRIQIEDSAATVDLLAKGWQVLHAPGRLTYSATPADFGALIIQRRRWANGGLLILPRLLRHALHQKLSLRRTRDALLRANNLISAAAVGVGLPLLLVCPFDDRLVPAWMPLMVLPYYALLGWDLRRAGYRWRDLANVCALTLLLIPANLAGTILSLRQAAGGKAIPFCRTPKILGRTRTPPAYVAACYAIPLLALLQAGSDAMEGRTIHLLYGSLIGLGALYGIGRLVGFRTSWKDLRAGLAVPPAAAALAGGWARRASPTPQVQLGGGD